MPNRKSRQLAEKIKAVRVKGLLSGEPVAKAVPILGELKRGSRAGLAAAELIPLASVAYFRLAQTYYIWKFQYYNIQLQRERVPLMEREREAEI